MGKKASKKSQARQGPSPAALQAPKDAPKDIPEEEKEFVKVAIEPRTWEMPRMEWWVLCSVMLALLISAGAHADEHLGVEIGVGVWVVFFTCVMGYASRKGESPVLLPAVSTPPDAPSCPLEPPTAPTADPSTASPLTMADTVNVLLSPSTSTDVLIYDENVDHTNTLALEAEVNKLKIQLETERAAFDQERNDMKLIADTHKKALVEKHETEKTALKTNQEKEMQILQTSFEKQRQTLTDEKKKAADDAGREKQTFNREIKNLKTQIQELEQTIKKLEQAKPVERETPKKQLKEMEEKLGELEKEKDVMREASTELEMKLVTNLEEELETLKLKEQVEDLKREKSEIEEEMLGYRRRVEADDKFIRDLNKEIKSLKEGLEIATKERKDAVEQRGKLDMEIDQVKAALRAEKTGNEEGWKRKQEEVRREHLRMAMVHKDVLESVAEKLKQNRTRHLSIAALSEEENEVYGTYVNCKIQMTESLRECLTMMYEMTTALKVFLELYSMTLDTDNISVLRSAVFSIEDVKQSLDTLHFPLPCDSVRTPQRVVFP